MSILAWKCCIGNCDFFGFVRPQVEKKLAGRLQAGMQAWTAALQGQKDEDIDIPMDTDTPDKPIHKPGGDPKVGNFFQIDISLRYSFHLKDKNIYFNFLNGSSSPFFSG